MIDRLRKNNFDLLRLALALIVCLVHTRDLSGAPQLAWVHMLSSKVAVDAFFVVSGFLVFMSYEKSRSLAMFAKKRVLRLYPAYLTIVLLCAFSLVAASRTPADYFNAAWLKYVASNVVFLNFLHPDLPGVFQDNTYKAVNGALWSLKVEVSFYLAVPLIGWMFRFGRGRVLVAIYLLSVAWVQAMLYLAAHQSPAYGELARQLPGALCFFVSGAAVYYYLPLFERHVVPIVAFAALALLLGRFLPLEGLYPAALAVVICCCALYGYAGNFGRHGDFSYGLYIVHFPIVQLLVASGAFGSHPFLAQASSVAAAMLGAVLMWNLVEKRFLMRTSHYVEATVSEPRPQAVAPVGAAD